MASTVDLFFRKPNWDLVIMSFLNRKLFNLLNIILSKHLERTGSKEIGL